MSQTIYGVTGSTATGVSVVASATPHTKGSWTEIAASLSEDIDGFQVTYAGSTGEAFLLDIGTGAAASEVVLVANIPRDSYDALGGNIYVPIALPSGTRIAARCQSDTISATLTVTIVAASAGDNSTTATQCETWGAATGTSLGTAITTSSAGVENAWVELTSSAGFDVKFLQVIWGQNADATMGNATYALDIGKGAASSEVIEIQDLLWATDSSKDSFRSYQSPLVPVDIASGTRVAARLLPSSTANSINVAVLAYDETAAGGGGDVSAGTGAAVSMSLGPNTVVELSLGDTVVWTA